MLSFAIILPFILAQEGGFTNNPYDRGGLTNMGISLADLPHGSNVNDIKNLTVDQAKAIYQDKYWDACKCSRLPGPVAAAVMDTAVTCGAGTAAKILQASLGVTADGLVGPITLAAANKANPTKLALDIIKARHDHNAASVHASPALRVFEDGWMNRDFDLLLFILTNT